MDLGRPQDKAPRPPAKLILTTPEHLIAFGFGAGLSPQAPGTVGTLWGLPVFLCIHWLPLPVYAVIVAGLFGFGVWICGRSAKMLGIHDSPGIVFDEIVGYLVTALPLVGRMHGHLWFWLLVAFAAFRVFDVFKPWPIKRLDASVHGGFGIMLDDLVAGFYGAAVVGGLTLVV